MFLNPKTGPRPHLILPVGTQVVTRIQVKLPDGRKPHPKGTVGEIVKSPTDNRHSYRVRFADGGEASLKRGQLSIRKHRHRQLIDRISDPVKEYDLYQYVIYCCLTGSRAYGLAMADSDEDRRGIYLPPADLTWSLYGAPEQLENQQTDECYWELQKFLTLALKGNPNILECLYSPIVEKATPLARELLAMREAFLSRIIFQTYNGYTMSQFKKIEQDLRQRGAVRWKHAMHLIRLLLCGITALEEMTVRVDVGPARDRLLAIRAGLMPWEELNAWRLKLHEKLEAAFRRTGLPEEPDYQRVNAFLLKARRTMV